MAIINEIDQKGFDEWLEERPEIIKQIATKVPPGRLYLLKSSNHRVFPYSYSEDGTLTVIVSGEYNSIIFERRVFGINPDELEECDLPDEDEVLGALLTEEYVTLTFDQIQKINSAIIWNTRSGPSMAVPDAD